MDKEAERDTECMFIFNAFLRPAPHSLLTEFADKRVSSHFKKRGPIPTFLKINIPVNKKTQRSRTKAWPTNRWLHKPKSEVMSAPQRPGIKLLLGPVDREQKHLGEAEKRPLKLNNIKKSLFVLARKSPTEKHRHQFGYKQNSRQSIEKP